MGEDEEVEESDTADFEEFKPDVTGSNGNIRFP
jgi:hypothetical protein